MRSANGSGTGAGRAGRQTHLDTARNAGLESSGWHSIPGFTQTPSSESSGSRLEGDIGGRISGGGAWARPVLAPDERR